MLEYTTSYAPAASDRHSQNITPERTKKQAARQNNYSRESGSVKKTFTRTRMGNTSDEKKMKGITTLYLYYILPKKI